MSTMKAKPAKIGKNGKAKGGSPSPTNGKPPEAKQTIKQIGPCTLLNFSGGIDSLWCLWDWARRHNEGDELVTKRTLIVHHCHLMNWTQRADHEGRAVTAIMKWLQENMPFPHVFVGTAFNFGALQITQDKEVIGFMTGAIMRDRRFRTDSVIISSNREDTSQADYSRFEYYVSSEADRIRIIEAVGHCRPRYLYPIKEKTKEELIRELPPELLALAWWCRVPVGEDGKPAADGKPCGKCQTCKKVLHVLEDVQAIEAEEVPVW